MTSIPWCASSPVWRGTCIAQWNYIWEHVSSNDGPIPQQRGIACMTAAARLRVRACVRVRVLPVFLTTKLLLFWHRTSSGWHQFLIQLTGIDLGVLLECICMYRVIAVDYNLKKWGHLIDVHWAERASLPRQENPSRVFAIHSMPSYSGLLQWGPRPRRVAVGRRRKQWCCRVGRVCVELHFLEPPPQSSKAVSPSFPIWWEDLLPWSPVRLQWGSPALSAAQVLSTTCPHTLTWED